MNEQRTSQHLRAVAEEEVPADLDLWPTIRSRLDGRLARRSLFPRRGPSAGGRGIAMAVGLAVLVVALGLMAAPKMPLHVVEFLGLDAILVKEPLPTAPATVPAMAFTGTPPSSTPKLTPTPVRVTLSIEDTPLPQSTP